MFNKKITGFIALIMIALLPSYAYASVGQDVFINDGTITLKGNIKDTFYEGDVTFTVVKEEVKWLDKSEWINGLDNDVVYFDITKTDKKGAYAVEFYLKDNGLYHAYIGADYLDAPDEREIKYINRDKYDSAILALRSATDKDGIETVLKNKRSELGLFEDIYDTTNISKVSEILYKDIAKLEIDSEYKDIQTIMLGVCLNEDKIDDIDKYKNYLFLEEKDCGKYYSDKFSKYLTKLMSGNDFGELKEIEDTLIESLILCNVNYNEGTETVKNILRDYSSKFGVTNTSITDNVVTKVLSQDEFSDFSTLKKFVSDNADKTQGGGNPGGNHGGNGGSGSSNISVNSNSYQGSSTVVPPTTSEMEQRDVFEDLADVEWAKTAITDLYFKNIVNGKTETSFCPNDTITREEFVKMLVSAFKIQLSNEELPFTDITEDDWCYPYVKSAYHAGITNGVSENVFGKGQNIIRQDICVMICNAITAIDFGFIDGSETEFIDSEYISDYAKSAVDIVSKAGIIQGEPDGRFNPLSYATRAEAAKIIYETINKSSAIN